MKHNKKYVLIITSEDERYDEKKVQLDFFTNYSWEGLLNDIVYGDSISELYTNGENEGLFYQLYEIGTGKRIGYGILNYDSLKEEIEDWERKDKELENVLKTLWKYDVGGYAFGVVIAKTKEEAEQKVYKKYDEVDFNNGVPNIRLCNVSSSETFDDDYPNIIEF